MIQQTVELTNSAGFHARPATKVVKIVAGGNSKVEIDFNGNVVNASSVITLLTLAAPQGSKFTITCDGEDEEGVLKQLVELIENKFDEE